MSAPASVALDEARSLLDDTAGNVWTDAFLLLKLQQAHRELQVQLRSVAAPVTRGTITSLVTALTTALATPPTDIIEPIKLWEKAIGDPDSNYVLMTEYDPLPIFAQTSRLIYWKWTQEALEFLGATVDRTVKIYYKRQITIPGSGTDPIGFIAGENFLGPRIAALAFGSTGNVNASAWCDGMANQTLADIFIANKGRSKLTARP